MTEINDLIDKTAEVALADPVRTSHADLVNIIPEVWAAQIERDAEKDRIFRNFCIINTDLLNGPGDTITIPKRALLDYDTYGPIDVADDLTELTVNGKLAVSLVEIKPIEKAQTGSVTRQIIDEARTSVMEQLMAEYSNNYAQKEDIDIIIAMVATTVGEEITFIEANQASDDYVSGKWTVAKAGTLAYADVGKKSKQLKWSATQSNLTAGDVLDLGVIIEAQDVIMDEAGFEGDVLVIHPKQKADLLRNPQFIDAAKYGNGSVLQTGEIGNFLGLRVFKSKNMPMLACGDGTVNGYQALLIDTRRACGLALKRTLMVDKEWVPKGRRWDLYMTWMSAAKRLNDGAIVAINTT